MAFKYILLEGAQIDYEESLQWYTVRSGTAAVNFIKAMEAAMNLICANPKRWRNKYKNYHELGLRKYPFSIIYIIDAEKELVIVTSVYHHRRTPKKRYNK
ncbi:MAG: type II toxin-antitoxin system RelE/ParE family toxin [Ferruginibacter sp.]|nr:type II toxin-antitoxin system RelE/ParE family toxin [Chitinophagaceae bacterium]